MSFDQLPVELHIMIFEYLDGMSLYNAEHVCTKWRDIILQYTRNGSWRKAVEFLWPLFPTKTNNLDFCKVFHNLIEQSSWLKRMIPYCGPVEKRRDLKGEVQAHCDGVDSQPLEGSYRHWQVSVEGPPGTPYAGGLFFLYMETHPNRPKKPVSVRFLTRIYHPNLSVNMEIRTDWFGKIDLSLLGHEILKTGAWVKQLMVAPNPIQHVVNYSAQKLFLKHKKAFREKAALWTKKYASSHVP